MCISEFRTYGEPTIRLSIIPATVNRVHFLHHQLLLHRRRRTPLSLQLSCSPRYHRRALASYPLLFELLVHVRRHRVGYVDYCRFQQLIFSFYATENCVQTECPRSLGACLFGSGSFLRVIRVCVPLLLSGSW